VPEAKSKKIGLLRAAVAVGLLGVSLLVWGAIRLKKEQPFKNSVGMEMVPIPTGSFAMGSMENASEQPVHTVRIVQAFHMASTEITQGQWEAIMGTRPWAEEANGQNGANFPAVDISWNDANEFCRRLSLKEGKPYRLPSEAEWEYAARAGGSDKWCFGNQEGNLGAYAWFNKNASDIGEDYGHAVGTKQANAFGLFDMHGNVVEWCEDTWHDSYDGAPSDSSAWVVNGQPTKRVIRGGAFYNGASSLRSAIRYGGLPDHRNRFLGFRVVCAASPFPPKSASSPNTPDAQALNGSTEEDPIKLDGPKVVMDGAGYPRIQGLVNNTSQRALDAQVQFDLVAPDGVILDGYNKTLLSIPSGGTRQIDIAIDPRYSNGRIRIRNVRWR
jgi:formylglycine-generating enzyme required for sulfatase activity